MQSCTTAKNLCIKGAQKGFGTKMHKCLVGCAKDYTNNILLTKASKIVKGILLILFNIFFLRRFNLN